jgi:hypothetical protein
MSEKTSSGVSNRSVGCSSSLPGIVTLSIGFRIVQAKHIRWRQMVAAVRTRIDDLLPEHGEIPRRSSDGPTQGLPQKLDEGNVPEAVSSDHHVLMLACVVHPVVVLFNLGLAPRMDFRRAVQSNVEKAREGMRRLQPILLDAVTKNNGIKTHSNLRSCTV